jgi:DNA repair exonuclease SbcCD ATPase subunit
VGKITEIFSTGLNESDRQELESLLQQLNHVNAKLTAKYELRNDLKQITDGRQAAAKIIKDEIELLRGEITNVTDLKDSLKTEINELLELKNNVQDIHNLLRTPWRNNILLVNHIQNIFSEENIKELEDKFTRLEKFYAEVFEDKKDFFDNFFEKIEKLDQYLFKDDVEFNEVKIKREQLLKKEYEFINKFYNEIFSKTTTEDEKTQIPISDKIKQYNKELSQFHWLCCTNRRKVELF